MEATPEPSRPRVLNACEACRAAKVKCRASNQLGICKRCLDSKRECIFKTGPRTRRPRQSKLNGDTVPPPPPGPSKTFTIDIPMAPDDVIDNFDILADEHEGHIQSLTPGMDSDSDDVDSESWTFASPPPSDPALTRANPSATNTSMYTPSQVITGIDPAVVSDNTPPNTTNTRSSTSTPSLLTSTGTGTNENKPQQQQQRQQPARSVASLGVQPRFNLDSAAALLRAFQTTMLPHFPCIHLSSDGEVVDEEQDDEDEREGGGAVTVPLLARTRPFVLLAILAAASGRVAVPGGGSSGGSGSSSGGGGGLGGTSLYDEEFRKVLGLKLVAGGERSLELLEGLIVYIAWYPFHLRPKNKQVFQYIRMAVDIVNDLELDQDQYFDPGATDASQAPSDCQLAEMRTYLATYFIVCNFAMGRHKTPSLQFTEYTSKCCEMLLKYGPAPGDRILPWHVRLQFIAEEVIKIDKMQREQPRSEYQAALMLKGIESQLTEWESCMPPEVALNVSLRLATLSIRVYVSAAPLLKPPITKSAAAAAAAGTSLPTTFRADPTRLTSVIPLLQSIYELVLSLRAIDINALSGPSWGFFVQSIVVGFRLSLPLPPRVMTLTQGSGLWDDAAARRMLRFDLYLDRLCRMGNDGGSSTGSGREQGRGGARGRGTEDGDTVMGSTATAPPALPGNDNDESGKRRAMDVLTATKVVLAVVRRKLRKRLAKMGDKGEGKNEAQQLQQSQQDTAAAATREPIAEVTAPFFHPTIPGHDQGLAISLGSGFEDEALQLSRDPPPGGCPMLDGSLEPYISCWDETFTYPHTAAGSTGKSPPSSRAGEVADQSGNDASHHANLWAAMTMNWAQHEINFDGL